MQADSSGTALGPPIGVVIITGLPGAGRTALLREILCTLPSSVAPAVCVHHFAKAFGLETSSPLTQTPSSSCGDAGLPPTAVVHYSEVYDFGSGCVCCSPDGDLARVLREIASSSDVNAGKGLQQRPSHLFIETTGLADPRPFVRVFEQSEHAALFSLLGVVAVLSAPDLLLRPETGDLSPEGERCALQLEVADVVLLNKADLLSSIDRQENTQPERLPADDVQAARAVAQAERLVAAHCSSSSRLHKVVLSLGSSTGEKIGWLELETLLPEAGAASCAVHCTDLTCDLPSDQSIDVGFAMPALNWGSGGHDSSFCTAVCVEDGAVLWPLAERWLVKLLQRVQRLQGYLAINERNSEISGHPCRAHGSDTECLVHIVNGVRGQPLQVERLVLPAPSNVSVDTNDAAERSQGILEDIGLAAVTAAKEPLCCKLFTASVSADGTAETGGPVRETELAAGLRRTMVPEEYSLIGDLTLDFPSALEYFSSGQHAAGATQADGEVGGAQRVIDIDAGREAVVSWTGSEFTCILRPANSEGASARCSADEDSPSESQVGIRVVGTKLYARTGQS